MTVKVYLLLIVAVMFETFGSSCLQASRQMTRLWPSLGILVGFTGALWFLMQVLKYLPLGITYALWSGIGIVLIALSGFLFFGQRLDWGGILGISLIIAGIAVINLFSKTAMH